ncbi:MAG: hypothetical protein ACP5QY_06530 [Candidatus Hydrogenedens sp.]
MYIRTVFCLLVIFTCIESFTFAQSAQIGAKLEGKFSMRLTIEKIIYRPAEWEKEKVKEIESDIVNKGGLVHIYYRNISKEPVHIRYWRWNRKDRSYWILNHFVAWDRYINQTVQPGELGVLEINAISEDFAPGTKFALQLVDENSRLCATMEGILVAEPVRITYIHVLQEMKEIDIFLRNFSKDTYRIDNTLFFPQNEIVVNWNVKELLPEGMAIARVRLSKPLSSGTWFIAGVEVSKDKGKTNELYFAHRRAFDDFFPIGVWTNNPETYETLYNLHVDTMVEGDKKDKPFFTEIAPKYGFRAMVITGVPLNVDIVREFTGHPQVGCWMLMDEPDWSIPANIVFLINQHLCQYDNTKPTFVTLCRNIKFFEYASICDIPCQDHYSVTAPSSSKWPKPYGTRLEETAYYTHDLKIASEPKPIWVWSQAIADWGERPKRPVPTPEELGAQLVLNLGRGAKGILWFNHDKSIAEKYPELERAMQGWGRVMCLLRDYFLCSEPIPFKGSAPENVDIAPLQGRDFIILCVTNLDYEIHPEAYPFKEKKNLKISINIPFQGQSLFEIRPQGITELKANWGKETSFVLPELKSETIIFIHTQPDIGNQLKSKWDEIISKEIKSLDK